MADAGSNLIVALDYDSPDAALDLAKRLDPATVRLKVGKQLFTLAGPDIVRSLQGLGFDIFLDLKFHDIPTTVAKAVKAAAELGVWMVNVHASGGSRMMRAAREALSDSPQPPLLVAVTVLTSMDRTIWPSSVAKTHPSTVFVSWQRWQNRPVLMVWSARPPRRPFCRRGSATGFCW